MCLISQTKILSISNNEIGIFMNDDAVFQKKILIPVTVNILIISNLQVLNSFEYKYK